MSDNLIKESPSGIIIQDQDDDDEDGWGTHELIIDRLPSQNESHDAKTGAKHRAGSDDEEVDGDSTCNELDAYLQSDDYWNDNAKKAGKLSDKGTKKEMDGEKKDSRTSTNTAANDNDNDGGIPMFLLDVTRLNPDIHSKYDRNSVNDPAEASKMRRQFERDFHQNTKNSNVELELIANGTIIPCSTSVWQAALSRMRDERRGHYFVPIFPPK